MRTQADVVALVSAAAKPFTCNFTTNGADLSVNFNKKSISLPVPAVGMSDAQAETYLRQVYDAIAIARFSDPTAVLRDKEGKLEDQLAFELGMRKAQAKAMDTWQGDASLYEKEYARLADSIATADFSGLDADQAKQLAASCVSLKQAAPQSQSIRRLLSSPSLPQSVRDMIAKVDVSKLPDSAKQAADVVRRILDINPPPPPPPSGGSGGSGNDDSKGDDEAEGEGEQGQEGDEQEEEQNGDKEGKSKATPKPEGDGKKPAPAEQKKQPPPVLKDIKPEDFKDTKKCVGPDGIGDYVCTSEEHVIVIDWENKERSRNSSSYNHLMAHSSVQSGMSMYSGLKLIERAEESPLVGHMRRLVQVKMRTRYQNGQTSGKINRRAIHRIMMPTVGDGQWNYQVFRKKHSPKDTTKTAVSILIDFSGSMEGYKTEMTMHAVACMSLAFNALHVKHSINTFTEGRNHADNVGHSLLINHIKGFDTHSSHADVVHRMAGASHHMTGNGDVDAVSWAYSRLICRKEPRKVLIVLSDGCPSAGRPGNGSVALKNFVSKVESEGKVEVYGVGIEDRAPTKFYTNVVLVPSAKDMERKLIDLAQHLFDNSEED